VRVMPYRTMDNRIDGVVITFANITAAKIVEARLREKNSDLTTHSAEQGRALERAAERLGPTAGAALRRDSGKPSRRKAAPTTNQAATGPAGKSQP